MERKIRLKDLDKAGQSDGTQGTGILWRGHINATAFTLTPNSVSIGEKLSIDFTLSSSEKHASKLVIDYVLERVLANGTLAKKVFKIANTTLNQNEFRCFGKTNDFTQRSTRTYYPGQHTIYLQVNGLIIADQAFELTR